MTSHELNELYKKQTNNKTMETKRNIWLFDAPDDLPQSDIELIERASKMEWGQIACQHLENDAKTDYTKEKLHRMVVSKYHREESRCGCL